MKRLLLLLFAATSGLSVGGWYVHSERRALDTPLDLGSEPYRLEVMAGSTLHDVAAHLSKRGILAHPSSLVWYARWKGVAHRIKAGEYLVEVSTTPLELLDLLISGRVIQWPFTIVEGWTFTQLRAALSNNEHLVHTLRDNSDAEVMAKLGRPGVPPEGWFYPDTYHFPSGTADLEVLERAMLAMEERLHAEWSGRSSKLPYLQPYEALVLASIVEKETGKANERKQIAGVFVRRLRNGIRLAADPTVIYGLGARFDGNLRRRDLDEDTPFNTYVRHGLPPTPIAMPGGDAIHAALHPADGDDLFFVARGDGSHHFSATFSEHVAAVEKYQRNRTRSGSGE